MGLFSIRFLFLFAVPPKQRNGTDVDVTQSLERMIFEKSSFGLSRTAQLVSLSLSQSVSHEVIYLLILASPEHFDYNDYDDYNDYNDYNGYNDYKHYRDSNLDLDLD